MKMKPITIQIAPGVTMDTQVPIETTAEQIAEFQKQQQALHEGYMAKLLNPDGGVKPLEQQTAAKPVERTPETATKVNAASTPQEVIAKSDDDSKVPNQGNDTPEQVVVTIVSIANERRSEFDTKRKLAIPAAPSNEVTRTVRIVDPKIIEQMKFKFPEDLERLEKFPRPEVAKAIVENAVEYDKLTHSRSALETKRCASVLSRLAVADESKSFREVAISRKSSEGYKPGLLSDLNYSSNELFSLLQGLEFKKPKGMKLDLTTAVRLTRHLTENNTFKSEIRAHLKGGQKIVPDDTVPTSSISVDELVGMHPQNIAELVYRVYGDSMETKITGNKANERATCLIVEAACAEKNRYDINALAQGNNQEVEGCLYDPDTEIPFNVHLNELQGLLFDVTGDEELSFNLSRILGSNESFDGTITVREVCSTETLSAEQHTAATGVIARNSNTQNITEVTEKVLTFLGLENLENRSTFSPDEVRARVTFLSTMDLGYPKHLARKKTNLEEEYYGFKIFTNDVDDKAHQERFSGLADKFIGLFESTSNNNLKNRGNVVHFLNERAKNGYVNETIRAIERLIYLKERDVKGTLDLFDEIHQAVLANEPEDKVQGLINEIRLNKTILDHRPDIKLKSVCKYYREGQYENKDGSFLLDVQGRDIQVDAEAELIGGDERFNQDIIFEYKSSPKTLTRTKKAEQLITHTAFARAQDAQLVIVIDRDKGKMKLVEYARGDDIASHRLEEIQSIQAALAVVEEERPIEKGYLQPRIWDKNGEDITGYFVDEDSKPDTIPMTA